jgi:uncharacterized FlgJ-related protein
MSVRKSKKLVLLLPMLGIALLGYLLLMKPKQTFNKKLILNSEYSQLLPYLIAQAKFETGNFSSRLANEFSNLYGMGCVKVRPTTQIGCTEPIFDTGGNRSMGIYKSWDKSIEDILLWLKYNNAPQSFVDVENYAYWLKSRGYFEVSTEQYIQGLKHFM